MKRFLFAVAIAVSAAAFAQQPAATGYQVSPAFPKYVTAHVEFRDPAGTRWPSFFFGKPGTNGIVRVDARQPVANFKLDCNQRPQKGGDQSRRVLGELFTDAKQGGVTVQVTSMRDLTAGEKGATKATLIGSLDVAGKAVPFTASATLRPHPGGKGDEKNESVMIEFRFETKAADLGLKTIDPTAPITVRGEVTAYSDAAMAAVAARKR